MTPLKLWFTDVALAGAIELMGKLKLKTMPGFYIIKLELILKKSNPALGILAEFYGKNIS